MTRAMGCGLLKVGSGPAEMRAMLLYAVGALFLRGALVVAVCRREGRGHIHDDRSQQERGEDHAANAIRATCLSRRGCMARRGAVHGSPSLRCPSFPSIGRDREVSEGGSEHVTDAGGERVGHLRPEGIFHVRSCATHLGQRVMACESEIGARADHLYPLPTVSAFSQVSKDVSRGMTGGSRSSAKVFHETRLLARGIRHRVPTNGLWMFPRCSG